MLEYSIFSYVTEAAPTLSLFFFFNDTATTEIYTLSLHDALPISVAHLVDEQEVADQQRVPHAGRGNAERLDQVGAQHDPDEHGHDDRGVPPLGPLVEGPPQLAQSVHGDRKLEAARSSGNRTFRPFLGIIELP